MVENTEQTQKEQAPGTLDVYRESRGYKLRQKINMMSPKKKLLLVVLPVLVIVAGLILYFVLAANSEAEIQLVWTGTNKSIDGATLGCGEKDKKVDVNIRENSDSIVTVGAYIAFDVKKIRVTKIVVTRSSFPWYEGDTDLTTTNNTLQKIDNTNGIVQIIRTKGADEGGFTAATGTIATIWFDVKDDATDGAVFTISQDDPNKSLFILKGGESAEPNNTGKKFTIDIKCCPDPYVICNELETCPDDNWFGNAEDRCCMETCVEAEKLFLEPESQEVNIGEKITAKLNIQRDVLDLDSIDAVLKLDKSDILSIASTDIAFDTRRSNGTPTASASGGNITINIPKYQRSNTTLANLATLTFTAENEGTVTITFDTAGTKLNYITSGGATTNLLSTTNSVTYTVTKRKIRLSNLTVSPSYNSVDFGWSTMPGAVCNLTIAGTTQRDTEGENHDFHFGSLQPNTTYTYTITCTKEDYEDYRSDGTFTTLETKDLVIKELKQTTLTSSRASVSWLTVGGTNNNAGDSYLCFRQVGSHSYKSKRSDTQTQKHAFELLGLEAGREYEFYVSSATERNDPRGFCKDDPPACDPSDPTKCAISARQTFRVQAVEESYDANIVLKVTKDRVCDEWLYCNASAEVLNTQKSPAISEDLCFQVGVCDKLSSGGRCANIVASSTPTRVTKESPDQVGDLKNYSGYTKAGIDWGNRCLNTGMICAGNSECGSGPLAKCQTAVVEGYYPYSEMSEVGIPIRIGNANFDDGTTEPWQSHGEAIIQIVKDGRTNKVMKISPMSGSYDGAIITNLTRSITTSNPDAKYIISFRAKSEDDAGQNILVELAYKKKGDTDYTYKKFKYYDPQDPNRTDTTALSLGVDWQEYVMTFSPAEIARDLGTEVVPMSLVIVRDKGSFSRKEFYIDNISMSSVLETGSPANYIARSCRLYPNQNAPACDYYDRDASKYYKGWKGYCVETDPGYQNPDNNIQPMCLLWWPVDIIQGESNIFSYSEGSTTGYTGRRPLYYCLEAAGNYKRFENTWDKNNGYVYNVNMDLGLVNNDVIFKEWTMADAFFPSYPYKELRLDEIEFIKIKLRYHSNEEQHGGGKDDNAKGDSEHELILSRANNWGAWVHPFLDANPQCAGPSNDSWEAAKPYFNTPASCHNLSTGTDGGADDCDLAGVKFKFENNEFKSISVGYCDDSPGNADLHIDNVTYYLREPCLTIARVVMPDGENAAWNSRINSQIIADTNWIGYTRGQDYAPFGSALVPSPVADPTKWVGSEPLYIEPADTYSFSEPYQERGGSPYGVVDYTNDRICSNDSTKTCKNNQDCPVTGGGGQVGDLDSLSASGGEYCFPGSYNGTPGSDTRVYCNDTQDCVDKLGGEVGNYVCGEVTKWLGPSGEQFEQCGSSVYNMATDNKHCVISFTTYGSCILKDNDRSVGQAICVSGSNIGESCTEGRSACGLVSETSDYGEYGRCVGMKFPEGASVDSVREKLKSGGIGNLSQLFAKSYGIWKWQKASTTNLYKYIRQEADADWSITNDMRFGQMPKVYGITVNGGGSESPSSYIIKQGPAVLRFSSWVNMDQQPLVRYTVDWGDGTVVTESGLQITPRSHVVVHYYRYDDDCDNNGSGYCVFQPKIQIEDNWGRCNVASDCSANAWNIFGSESQNTGVRVYKDEVTFPVSMMRVAPAELNFYNNIQERAGEGAMLYLPFTKYFEITNSSTVGSDLTWKIDKNSITGFLRDYLNDPDGSGPQTLSARISSYGGILSPGETVRVGVTIYGSRETADEVKLTSDITVINVNDSSKPGTVKVNLTTRK